MQRMSFLDYQNAFAPPVVVLSIVLSPLCEASTKAKQGMDSTEHSMQSS